jgi:diketogulonate reductase-like aldo/keto reductase
VLLEWSLRQGISVIPRSGDIRHLKLNYDAAMATFSLSQGSTERLSDDDMTLLSIIANLVASPFVKPMLAAAEPY